MFSLGKLAVLAVILLVILVAWRFFRRPAVGKPKDKMTLDAADTTQCSVCGVYVPVSGATPCGRDDCPF
jgi:hypothetical protein